MNRFSIIIPCLNEGKNLLDLIPEIFDKIKNKFVYELIIVDDCSTDETEKIIKNKFNDPRIKYIRNHKNIGQSYSILNGILASKYNDIVTIDGDGQNLPSDINIIADYYFKNSNIQLVGGIRAKRKDSLSKKIASKIANSIRKAILKDKCDDTGCSLKIFNKEIFLSFSFFDGIHRFMPALFNGYKYETYYIKVSHRFRVHGKTKYNNILRLIIGIRDIYKVYKDIRNR